MLCAALRGEGEHGDPRLGLDQGGERPGRGDGDRRHLVGIRVGHHPAVAEGHRSTVRQNQQEAAGDHVGAGGQPQDPQASPQDVGGRTGGPGDGGISCPGPNQNCRRHDRVVGVQPTGLCVGGSIGNGSDRPVKHRVDRDRQPPTYQNGCSGVSPGVPQVRQHHPRRIRRRPGMPVSQHARSGASIHLRSSRSSARRFSPCPARG